jgi:peptidoglycan/xylan/chitin deacetylase (PgdA/CDA1 family)
LLYPLSEADRLQTQDELLHWSGVSPAPAARERRMLTSQEAATLVADGLVESGAHTVSHPLLAARPAATQRAEIQGSKIHLEGVVGRPIVDFAYPFGKLGDYTDESVAIVKACGFQTACANIPGLVSQSTDPYQLPRMFMGNWSRAEFARKLAEWFAE